MSDLKATKYLVITFLVWLAFMCLFANWPQPTQANDQSVGSHLSDITRELRGIRDEIRTQGNKCRN